LSSNSGLVGHTVGGHLKLTREGENSLWELIPDENYSNHPDVGGGLRAWTVDGTNAHWNISIPRNTILHWNIYVPGGSGSQHNLADAERISRYVRSGSGVYRLIGLDGTGKPATLDRVGGRDKTGTLYIGCFYDRHRILQLDRSLRPPRRRNRGYSYEHEAPRRLRRHSPLSKRFPISRLAINWCYSNEYALARLERTRR
jgi:hypothetical protein